MDERDYYFSIGEIKAYTYSGDEGAYIVYDAKSEDEIREIYFEVMGADEDEFCFPTYEEQRRQLEEQNREEEKRGNESVSETEACE